MNNNNIPFFSLLFVSQIIGAMSADRQFFSIINNTNEDFNVEISYGAPATTAKPNTRAQSPDVTISGSYKDKLLFEFPAQSGVDILKTEIMRWPMYIKLVRANAPVSIDNQRSGASVFQKADASIRKEVAVGVDNVNKSNGIVFNADPTGVLSYKFFDVRPDTKVIRASPLMIRKR